MVALNSGDLYYCLTNFSTSNGGSATLDYKGLQKSGQVGCPGNFNGD